SGAVPPGIPARRPDDRVPEDRCDPARRTRPRDHDRSAARHPGERGCRQGLPGGGRAMTSGTSDLDPGAEQKGPDMTSTAVDPVEAPPPEPKAPDERIRETSTVAKLLAVPGAGAVIALVAVYLFFVVVAHD